MLEPSLKARSSNVGNRRSSAIAFPVDNVGANLPAHLSTIGGNLFELGEITGLRLLHIDMPGEYAQQWHLESINGEPLDTYYRWLGLTYLVSLMTNPALSLPCGVDHAGMPSGVQLIGPVRGDARLPEISEALEAAFDTDDALCRPVPDLKALSGPAPELRSIVTSPRVSPASSGADLA
nr:amidase family protein [Caballeronia sp. Lep1P3]